VRHSKFTSSLKMIFKIVVSVVIRLVVFFYFWFIRWVLNQRFFRNDKGMALPSFLVRPIVFIHAAIVFIKKTWREEFSNYAVKKYPEFIKNHYSKQGAGYLNYENLSEAEYLEIYNGLKSRLSYYITNHKKLLDYQNGTSFLDMGCGKGENIKGLVERYPNSKIKGFDINNGALNVAKTALRDNPNVQIEQGSVIDFSYLTTYPANSVDHVIMSHVIAFLMDISIKATKELRQNIINQLIRIARKSVIILDGNIVSDQVEPKLLIEHNTRCVFHESLVPYFAQYKSIGELYMAFESVEKSACIFCFNSEPD
jgi:ubiquinone/menaquinone biosynthesis C-methylase UbiE